MSMKELIRADPKDFPENLNLPRPMIYKLLTIVVGALAVCASVAGANPLEERQTVKIQIMSTLTHL